jgi:predicted Zn-dependent protease
LSEASHSFEAHAFHPSLGNEVVEGSIVVDRWQFHFQSETVTLDIPLVRLRARTGDGEDDRIYFWDSANPEWEVFTFDERVLEHPFIAASNNLREQLSNEASKRELSKRLRVLAYVVGTCLLLVWLGQLAVSAMVRSLVARIPPEIEQTMGDELIVELQDVMTFLEDSNRVANLVALAAPLTSAMGAQATNFQFYIVEEESPNAFALPGGHVVVTTGLLQASDRPEQLLGVIAHEVAHVTQKHGIRQVISSAGPFLIFRVFLGGSGTGGMLGQASELLVQSSFSQEYETEADEEGWRALVAAKIDPRGMTETFEKLRAYEMAQEVAFDIPQAFSSHPAMEKRIARLEKKWRKLSPKDGFQDLRPLQRHLKAATGE